MSPLLRATVRLQFHKTFTLDDASAIVPYLAALGVSHVYASPLLAAAQGSTHGYDTTDPTRIDPDRGGEAGLRRFSTTLKAHGLGLILDIVPNHMGIAADGNPWWDDVLAHGRHGRHGAFFDIDWTPPDPTLHDRVLLPFLGASLDETLDAHELTLQLHPLHGYALLHGARHYPVRPEDHAAIRTAFTTNPRAFDSRDKDGRQALFDLLSRQHYRLCSWRAGDALINWRRFFNVTTLAALRMEDDTVFEAAHALVFDLYRDGVIDGVRCDHIDGLTRPAAYCRKLHDRLAALRPGTIPAIYVEKILRRDEVLPQNWPVSGTTGYEFLEDVSLLLHDPRVAEPLEALWEQIGGRTFAALEHDARRAMLDGAFRTERARLVRLCHAITSPGSDITRDDLDRVLCAVMQAFPTYRSYLADDPSPELPDFALEAALAAAHDTLPEPLHHLIAWVGQVLEGTLPGIDRKAHHEIAAQFEHLTAPLAAKAGEDTAFYQMTRALSRVDVGGDPGLLSQDIPQFHAHNAARPLTGMITTSTHDHKRGADTRVRLAVLSEPEANWPLTAWEWLKDHAAWRDGGPDLHDTLMIYQAVIGAWPMAGLPDTSLRERLLAFLPKALREAARHTRWDAPNARYEQACAHFLTRLLESGPSSRAIAEYVASIVRSGALNSLSQALLRLTSPGVPDLYQGCEYWDLSLVDPDNRRPVDFAARAASLRSGETLAQAATHWQDGAVLQRLVATMLQLRRDTPDLFALGAYRPVVVRGALAQHLVAFRRVIEDEGHPMRGEEILVLAPRLTMALNPAENLTISDARWGRTSLDLPHDGRPWTSVFTTDQLWSGPTLEILDGALPLGVWRRTRKQ